MEHDPLGGGCNTLMSLSECRELREHSILVIRHDDVAILVADGWWPILSPTPAEGLGWGC